MKPIWIFTLLLILVIADLSNLAWADGRHRSQASPSDLSWDLGGAFGSYNGYSYSEIDLGLNYRFTEPWNWRNVAWDRIGNAPVAVAGVDSSLRFEFGDSSRSSDVGCRIFVGPGVRISSQQYTGVFGEGGLIFRVGGLNLGAGVKVLNYFSPGKDPVTNATFSSQDTVLFIIIAGGGSL